MNIEDKVMFNIIDNEELYITDELYYALRREISISIRSGSEVGVGEAQELLHLLGTQLLQTNIAEIAQQDDPVD